MQRADTHAIAHLAIPHNAYGTIATEFPQINVLRLYPLPLIYCSFGWKMTSRILKKSAAKKLISHFPDGTFEA